MGRGAGVWTDWVKRFERDTARVDKVLPLAEAVRRAVRPGMTLHFAYTHNRPTAAIAELLRRFRNADPGFTMVLLFTGGPALALLTHGLVRRLVTTLIFMAGGIVTTHLLFRVVFQ